MVKQVEIVKAKFDDERANKKIYPYAEQLITDGQCHIYADKILFVVNNKSCDSKKLRTLAKTSKIPHQACLYVYMIEFYAKKSAPMDDMQLVPLAYCELRQSEPEGEPLSSYVANWWQLLIGLGSKRYYPDCSCPNLPDNNAKWKRLMETHYEEIRDSTKE